jgi:Cu2+-containing amine oxidase
MTTFLNRLKVYGIGFGIGLVFVFFFFQNRGCSWLPGNRVKNSILDRVIVVSDEEAALLKSKGITTKEIISLLNEGKVDFQKSRKNTASKIYYLSHDELAVYFTLPAESFISEVKLANQKVAQIKNTTEGLGRFIHFPKDDDLVFADTLAKMNCQQQQIGMIQSRMILKSLQQNGTIDFAKTRFNVKPKAEQYLEFNDPKGRRIGANTVWYKNKITLHTLDLPFKDTCR